MELDLITAFSITLAVISFLATILSWKFTISSTKKSAFQIADLKEQNDKLERQNSRLQELFEKERQHFTWEEIQTGCRKLAQVIDEFKADCIVTSPGSPMLVAALVVEILHQWLPVHIIMVSDPTVKDAPEQFETETYVKLSSAHRRWFVPRKLFEKKDLRAVIVDDVIYNTVYFEKIIETLEATGFERKNLHTVSLIAGANLEKSEALDFSSYFVSNTLLYLPWGEEKIRMKP